jgi:hypothetical protein
MVLAARSRDAVTKPGPDPRAFWKHRIADCGSQPRGTFGHLGARDSVVQGPFDPAGHIHRKLLI